MPSAANVRSAVVPDDVPEVRKIRSRHSWKVGNVSHQKTPPRSRESIRYVQKEIAKRKEKFHFSKEEIDALCLLFRYLVQDGETNALDRTRFQDFLHNMFETTEDIILDRVFKVFDRDNDGQVNMLEWIIGLNVYLRGTLHEKIAFAFDCYSLKGEKFITRQEIFQLLKSSVPKQMNEENPIESIKELVEITLRKMDKDRDNRLSDDDFAASVHGDPLLLCCFGQIFPSSSKREVFEQIAFGQQLNKEQLKTIFDYKNN
ncbi:unnamed protein product [Adineta ricciae]|uniref:EF-hand domain-containing protein n=1 Tax=Adineta ricciae TaxID=249248 RepID=A0A814FBA7_ADIRI|nr:unnamed protein product [Adineta ricciae]